MGTGELDSSDGLRRRLAAAEILGLAPEATPEAARMAFLRRLQEAQFVPGKDEIEAFAILAGRTVPRSRVLEAAEAAQAVQLAGRVEAFAADFFSLAVPERHARWTQLVAACQGHGHLERRLRQLEQGLTLTRDDARDDASQTATLAAHCRELFVLPDRRRALRRQELVEQLRAGCDAEAARWARTAKALRRSHPAIARIAPEFVDALTARWRPHIRRRVLTRDGRDVKIHVGSRVWLFGALGVLCIGVLAALTKKDVEDEKSSLVRRFPMMKQDPGLSILHSGMRDRFQRELAALGYQIHVQVINDVVAEFTADSLRSLPFFGTEEEVKAEFVHDRERLGEALQKHGIVLDTEALEHLMKTCANRVYMVAPAPPDGVGSWRQQTREGEPL
jgi:hypothetical protein